jgi:hypothetical protein
MLATGVDLSAGGTWYRQAELVVRAVAGGSSTSLTKGAGKPVRNVLMSTSGLPHTSGVQDSRVANRARAAVKCSKPRASPSPLEASLFEVQRLITFTDACGR